MAGMYRIGPSDFFNNDDLKADALTLDGQINQLDDLPMEKVSDDWFKGWQAFWSEWKKFYSGTILGGLFGPAWNNSNRDQLIQFEQRFATWAAEYATQTKEPLPGGVVEPSKGSADTFGAHLANQLKPLTQPLLAVWDANKAIVIGVGVVIALIYFREPIKTAIASIGRK